MTISTTIDLSVLIADTEAEIQRSSGPRRVDCASVYEMIRYHSGPRRRRRSARQAHAPARSFAYMSSPGTIAPPCRVPRRVELGRNFSLVHDDIEDGDVERRTGRRCGRSMRVHRRSTRAT
jgi:geranylgeranyl pyrophosphate synthase